MLNGRRLIIIGAILAAAVLAMAGCGSKGDGADAGAQAENASESVSGTAPDDAAELQEGEGEDDSLQAEEGDEGQAVYTLQPGDAAMAAISGALYIDSLAVMEESDE